MADSWMGIQNFNEISAAYESVEFTLIYKLIPWD